MVVSIAFVVSLLLVGVPLGASAQPAGAEDAAQKAALTWLALVDGGKYAESWADASSAFKKAVTAEQWTEAVVKARSEFGPFGSRAINSRQYSTSLPGAPPGEYVVLMFDGHFEKRAAVETVVMLLDTDKTWRVAGAFIR